MNTQNLFTTSHTWKRHGNLTIKATWSEKCIIKNINSVGGCNNNNTSFIIKAIHLCKKLIDSLFAFIIRWHTTSTTLLTNGINLINEDNTRLVLTSHLKEVAHSLSTHTNEHLNKVRGGALDERNIRFTCDSAGEKSLPGSRLTCEEGTSWDLGTTSKVAFWILEKINNLLKFI